jgi:chitodextrinase
MGYLRYLDYQRQIQDANFQQVIASNDSLRLSMERAAQAEMISYLVQKYDVATEFKDTTIYSNTAIYKAGSLVELSGYYAAWSNASLYLVGDFISYTGGNVYRCILNTTTAHEAPTNTTYWVLVGTINDLFYIANPYPTFDVIAFYSIGDFVFWKDKIYKCLIETRKQSHEGDLQDELISNIPLYNIFPDDKIHGKQYWGVGTPYSVTGLIPNATPPTAWSSVTAYTAGQRISYSGLIWKALLNNTNKIPGSDITNWQSETWVAGDNRDQQLVLYMVDIALFHLLSRISPRNIPELRMARYTAAKEWLQDAANGTITAAIKVLQPFQGNRIRFGGGVKNNWG